MALHTLESLQDSVWAESLLPMLVEQGSVSSCALSCKQLRQLIQSQASALKIPASECIEPSTTLERITEQFPACSSISLTVASQEQAAELTRVLHHLSRLGALSNLDLDFSQGSGESSHVSPLLSTVQQRLTQLRALSLSLADKWGTSSEPWQLLSCIPQLQRLAISFDSSVQDPFSLKHCLAGLTGLDSSSLTSSSSSSSSSLTSSLTSLSINAELSACAATDYQGLSRLTALQQLSLAVRSDQGLGGIAACTALRCLRLDMCVEALPKLESDVLTQLTLLTELRLPKLAGIASRPALLAALQKLQQLEVLQARGLTASACLPVLAQLTRLSELAGDWKRERAAAAAEGAAGGVAAAAVTTTAAGSSVCSSVRLLCGSGRIPFQAFPNLEAVQQHAPWPPSTFSSLCQHCPSLRRIKANEGFKQVPPSYEDISDSDVSDFDGDFDGDRREPAPVAKRIAAIRGLGCLQSLKELTLKLEHRVELAVLAKEAPQHLAVLHVVFRDYCSDSAAGLMSLAALRQLQLLVLELPGYGVWSGRDPFDIQCVLSALSGGPAVRMLLAKHAAGKVQQAVLQAQQLGMHLPQELTFGESQRWR